MDSKELFKQAIRQATVIVEQVRPSDLDKPTPDTEWDVRTLVGHMLYELSWTADIVRGATIAQVGDRYDGDLIGDDLLGHWQQAVTAANEAVERCGLAGIAHLSYGHVSNEKYLREAASDQLIHAWDLATAIDQPMHFKPAVAQAVYQNTLPKADTMQASGLFAPPIEVPKDTDLQTKLLALFGRRG